MLKRLITVMLLGVATCAEAIDYSDVYSDPAEQGWGLFAAQSDTFQFLAFYIYGPDNKPIWYTAQLTQNASGKFTGELYLTTGTYYGMPWNSQARTILQVGVASFEPTSPTTATLTYALTNGPSVTKNIQRHTFTPITLGGTYFGGQSGGYSGCTSAANNAQYVDSYSLLVTQSSPGAATLRFEYTGGLVCTLSGALAQSGKLYTMPGATYACSDGLQTTAGVTEVQATSLGIEGRFTAPSAGQGCREDAQFSAVLR